MGPGFGRLDQCCRWGDSTINGETFNISGNIKVVDNATLNINAPSTYNASANVAIEDGSVLNMGTVTYNGGSYTGGGILRKGAATIAANTTWDVATVDIDDGSTTVNNGALLTVNTDSIDDANDGIDGTVTIEDTGRIEFNLSGGSSVVFDSGGILNYTGNASENTFLTGSPIQMNGTMNIAGDGQSDARIILGSGGQINLNNINEPLRLGGGNLTTTNRIEGGTISGPGRVGMEFSRALVGYGTINSDIQFFNSGNRVTADDGTLTINGAFIGGGGSTGTEDADGILDVTNPWSTSGFVNVRLQGGEIRGALITNNGTQGILGNGLLAARVSNNTRITAQSGGTLVVQTSGNNNDWDGAANNGQLIADSADLEIRDNSTFLFAGSVTAESGREVFANGFELEFEPASTLTLNRGTYRSTNATDFGGTMSVGAGGPSTLAISGTAIFESTSTTTLTGNLRLDNSVTRIQSGASISGGGELTNLSGRNLSLDAGAVVSTVVANEGDLNINLAGIGNATVQDLDLDGGGRFNLDVNGTGLAAFDRLAVNGTAFLDGVLDVDFGFAGVLGDTFPFMTFLARSGTFGSLDVTGLGLGLTAVVDYNPTSAVLRIATALPGDFDFDGDVDGNDFLIWQRGGSPTPLSPSDLADWQAGYGSPLTAATGAVPEPTSFALAALGLVACVVRRRS